MKTVLIAMLLLAPCVHAQVFQVDGGAGTLLTGGQSAGGVGITTYFPDNTVYTGFAIKDGRFIRWGVKPRRLRRGYKPLW